MAWSVEAGVPRLSYGFGSDAYVGSVVGSATLRRGIFDWLTVEGHAEAGDGVANGGIGADVKTGNFGVAGAALSASKSDRGAGLQVYVAYETHLFGFNLAASSQRTFASYDDLASSTGRLRAAVTVPLQDFSGFFSYLPAALSTLPAAAPIYATFRPPRAIDRITLGMPLRFDNRADVSVSYIHLLDTFGTNSDILTGTYTRSLPFGASLSATLFRDFGTNRSLGVFAGLSVPLGNSVSASTSFARTRYNSTLATEAVKSPGIDPGSYGWYVRDAEGSTVYRQASASYRSNHGTVQVGASENGSKTGLALELRGSITTMGGGIFLSNWIDDSFAVVDAGAPGIEVLSENRNAGFTNARGLLLVPTLRAYQRNKIAVDPTNLPVDAEIENTHEVVAPADRAGLLVKFRTRSDTASALVTFARIDGSFVPAGSIGHTEHDQEFIVGYDGEAFIGSLEDNNRVSIEMAAGSCTATFPFAPRPGEQIRVGPVSCR